MSKVLNNEDEKMRLKRAKEFIKRNKKPTYRLKIPFGMVVTTDPETWFKFYPEAELIDEDK